MGFTKIDMKTMVPVAQEDSATCWYAGYRMMFQWAQKPRSSIENFLRWEIGQDALDECKQRGLLRKYWGNACYAFGLQGHSGRAKTSYDYVKNLLVIAGPVIFHYTRNPGIHTIVLIGYDDDSQRFLIIDPWWDAGTAAVASQYGMHIDAISAGIRGSDGWEGVLQHWSGL